jgi:hypothetical protein
MSDGSAPSAYRVVSLSLVLVNVAAITYAILDGGSGQWDYHFRESAFIPWLGSAQMLGAALLFVACYFAGAIIRLEGDTAHANRTWLVFAVGFFLLAIDQQFRLREHLTMIIDGPGRAGGGTSTLLLLKIIVTVVAVSLVIWFRTTVLANFRMVVSFAAGFWFLLFMLLVSMLFESLGLPPWAARVLEGAGKLLAMAMFLTASYVALFDRLRAIHATAPLCAGQAGNSGPSIELFTKGERIAYTSIEQSHGADGRSVTSGVAAEERREAEGAEPSVLGDTAVAGVEAPVDEPKEPSRS